MRKDEKGKRLPRKVPNIGYMPNPADRHKERARAAAVVQNRHLRQITHTIERQLLVVPPEDWELVEFPN